METVKSPELQLLDIVQNQLEKNDVLQSLRSQLRAHVYNILKSASNDNETKYHIPKISVDSSTSNRFMRYILSLMIFDVLSL